MVMETPSPQCVGREFVRQYYTLLNQAPQYLHRFYGKNSSFVHGGVDKPGEEKQSVVGQQDIHDKILSLNFQDCHAKIRQVDSQSTVGDGVVVQVTGELSNHGEPLRRFMQTFVLSPQQQPNKFYVHNDIFCYQDEVFDDEGTLEEEEDEEPNELPTPVHSNLNHDSSTQNVALGSQSMSAQGHSMQGIPSQGAAPSGPQGAAPSGPQGAAPSGPQGAAHAGPQGAAIHGQQGPASQVLSPLASIGAQVHTSPAFAQQGQSLQTITQPIIVPVTQGLSSQALPKVAPVQSSENKYYPQSSSAVASQKPLSVQTPPQEVPLVNGNGHHNDVHEKPLTTQQSPRHYAEPEKDFQHNNADPTPLEQRKYNSWASLIQTSAGVPNSFNSAPTSKPSTEPVESVSYMPQGGDPTAQMGPRGNRNDRSNRGDMQRLRQPDSSAPSGLTAHSTFRGELDEKPGREPREPRYPDDHQVFVGNLPQDITEGDLRNFFKSYGHVMEVRVNRSQGNNKAQFGFVVFDNDKPVKKILSEKQLDYNGQRLNVEEKKARRDGRPSSGPRSGERRDGAFGSRPSPRGSRGPYIPRESSGNQQEGATGYSGARGGAALSQRR